MLHLWRCHLGGHGLRVGLVRGVRAVGLLVLRLEESALVEHLTLHLVVRHLLLLLLPRVHLPLERLLHHRVALIVGLLLLRLLHYLSLKLLVVESFLNLVGAEVLRLHLSHVAANARALRGAERGELLLHPLLALWIDRRG